MKLAVRSVVLMAAPLVALTIVFALVEHALVRAPVREELASQGRVVAVGMRRALENALRDRQVADVRALVDAHAGGDRIVGIRVFDASGRVTYESASLQSRPAADRGALALALRNRSSQEATSEIDGEPVITLITPLEGAKGTLFGAFELVQLESSIGAADAASRRAMLTFSAASLFAVGIVAFVVTKATISRPIENILRRFREVNPGDLSARVDVRGGDELADLAAEFNRMCGRLEDAQRSLTSEHERRHRVEMRLARSERLASLGSLAAGVAHEIGTPLNVIGGHAEALMEKAGSHPEMLRDLRAITSEIDRITRMVRNMLDFARVRKPNLAPTRTREILSEVLGRVQHACESRGIQVRVSSMGSDDAVIADPDQLHQVFTNLVGNAIDAMPSGGDLNVDMGGEALFNPDMTGPLSRFRVITFSDTGVGIPPENLKRIFEPFFTTKRSGKGTGLGLSVCEGIVREHGGWMSVTSVEGSGAMFTVNLPIGPSQGGGAPS